jgi:L-fuconolactonase
MRIDAHQHFWRVERGDYGWLTPALKSIYRNFEEADLAPILQRHHIAKTILVQAAPTEAETDYMLSVARRTDFVAGVVGWIDFEAADAAERIAARPEEPLLKGLRPMIHDLADDDWMLRPELAPAFEAVVARRLCFDALVKPRHLRWLIRLVERHPALRVVIDHGAKPMIAAWTPGDAAFSLWAEQMRVLADAGCFMKLSGLATEAAPHWTAADLQPYVDVLLDCFGPAKTMWGSDWPVVILAGGYDAWWAAAGDVLAGCNSEDRASILGGTAAKYYGV